MKIKGPRIIPRFRKFVIEPAIPGITSLQGDGKR